MAKHNQPFTGYTYISMPDNTELLMTKIENIGLQNLRITHYITQEQRDESSRKMMENTGEVMSEYYSQKVKS